MLDLHWTEIDGVTTVWASAPEPLRAGLLFRVGKVDETLITAGQTHLLEHMTLSAIADPTHTHNGFVGAGVTGFVTYGQEHDVSKFFARVCGLLGDLPGERLESEKRIITTEGAARRYDFRSTLLMWRYGAAGYGTLAFPDYGIRHVTLEQLRHRSAQWFTKENAVLWLSGPPPAGLRLDLPRGTKHPLPKLAPIKSTFPGWFIDDECGGVGAGSIVPRDSASTVLCALVHKRLHDQLRTAHAISYSPQVFYDHLTADTAHLVLYADSHEEHRAELTKLFGQVFEDLNQISDEELEITKTQLYEHWTGALAPPLADRILMELQRATLDWLFGKPFETSDRLISEMQTITTSEVAQFVQAMRANVIFALPTGAAIQPWIGKPIALSSARVVQGQWLAPPDGRTYVEQLVHGQEGMSFLWPDGSHSTVRYSDLAAALSFDDGGLHLIGSDATYLRIEPTFWRDGQKVCREIRHRIPGHLLLDRGARPAKAIPQPPPKPTLEERVRSHWERLFGKKPSPHR